VVEEKGYWGVNWIGRPYGSPSFTRVGTDIILAPFKWWRAVHLEFISWCLYFATVSLFITPIYSSAEHGPCLILFLRITLWWHSKADTISLAALLLLS